MTLTRRHCLACAAALPLFAACGEKQESTALPVEFDRATSCELDGMLLADYPGPKAQIHYAGLAAPHFFCDTVEMFAMLLQPEQLRVVRAVYVQDMGRADWDQPRGHWIDARSAYYVRGSRRRGAMGPTLASFASADDARRFADEWGGEVLAYAAVTPAMVDLSGGALHDTRM